MVTKGLEKRERIILAIAVAIALFMSYFLYDDSLLFDRFSSDQIQLGSIATYRNDVRKKSASRFVWQPVRGDDVVSLGDRVFTGPSSFAEVQLSDGSKVTLAPNSLIVFEKKEGQVALNLKFGQIKGQLAGDVLLKVNDKQVKNKGQIIASSAEPVKSRKPAAEDIQWVQAPPPLFLHSGRGTLLPLAWKSKMWLGRYRVQASPTRSFDKIIYEETTVDQRVTIRNYPLEGQYYFRVVAEDLTGEIVASTSISKIQLEQVDVPVITEPNFLSLNFKTDPDGDPFDKPQIRVSWEYQKANTFIYQMASDENFNHIVTEYHQKGLTAITPFSGPGSYFVRVRDAASKKGIPMPWSEAKRINVAYEKPIPLETPTLYTQNIFYSQDNPVAPYITWENIKGASKYELELSDTPNFEESRTVFSPSSQLTFKNWIPGQHYFRVYALTKKGLRSNASETGKLRVLAARPELLPNDPKIVLGKTPDDQGNPTEMPLGWKGSEHAKNFLVEVSEDPVFKKTLKFESRSPSSVVTLPKPGKYYWRVQAQNERGQAISNYSETGSLNYILKVPLSTPQLFEPKNETTLFYQKYQPAYLWVQWSPVRQAANYVIEISKHPSFEQLAFRKSIESTKFLITEQLPQGPLFWRIRAESDSGRVSNWSEVRRFSVLSGRRVLLSE